MIDGNKVYEKVGENRSRIYVKLMHPGNLRKMEREILALDFLDMKMVFYMQLGIASDEYLNMMIANKHLEKWNISPEELRDLALENSRRDRKPVMEALERVLQEAGFELEGRVEGLYLISNECRQNGAAVLLYEDFLKNTAEMLDGDFYVLPSSVHECLVLRCGAEASASYLREMVESVNDTELEKKDILSYSVYRYDRRSRSLMIDNS